MMGLGDDILSVWLKASTSYQRGSAGFRSGLCADHSNSSTLDRINQLSSSKASANTVGFDDIASSSSLGHSDITL